LLLAEAKFAQAVAQFGRRGQFLDATVVPAATWLKGQTEGPAQWLQRLDRVAPVFSQRHNVSHRDVEASRFLPRAGQFWLPSFEQGRGGIMLRISTPTCAARPPDCSKQLRLLKEYQLFGLTEWSLVKVSIMRGRPSSSGCGGKFR